MKREKRRYILLSALELVAESLWLNTVLHAQLSFQLLYTTLQSHVILDYRQLLTMPHQRSQQDCWKMNPYITTFGKKVVMTRENNTQKVIFKNKNNCIPEIGEIQVDRARKKTHLPLRFSSGSTYFETGPLVPSFSMFSFMSSTWFCSLLITSSTLQ